MNNLSFLKDRITSIDQRTRSYAAAALLLLLPMLTVSVLADKAHAQVQAPRPSDRIISYQAQILNAGMPVTDGQYLITASLYSDAEGRSLLWRSTYATEVRGGIANLNLGEVRTGGVPLPTEGLDGPLYLGISVGSSAEEVGEEMRPLTRLSSSVNALSVADGSITKEKLATSYVEKIIVGGDTLDGKARLQSGQGYCSHDRQFRSCSDQCIATARQFS